MLTRLPLPPQRLAPVDTLRVTARNLAMVHELRTMLTACRHAGITCAPLRGPALAEALYEDATARPMGDLDLLVRKTELASVQTMMQRLGYQLCDRRPGFAQAFSYTWEFFKTEPVPMIVEPHWSIAYPPFVERLDM